MWTYKGKEVTDEDVSEYTAFVYIITNLKTGKRYIGKKNLEFYRRKKVKGRTRRKRVSTESDWRTYFGSSRTLLDDVASLGEENFSREILHLCKTRGTASYLELKEQILQNALESDQFYNDWIRVRIHKSHIKL